MTAPATTGQGLLATWLCVLALLVAILLFIIDCTCCGASVASWCRQGAEPR